MARQGAAGIRTVKGICAVCHEPVLASQLRTKSASTGKYSHRECSDAILRGAKAGSTVKPPSLTAEQSVLALLPDHGSLMGSGGEQASDCPQGTYETRTDLQQRVDQLSIESQQRMARHAQELDAEREASRVDNRGIEELWMQAEAELQAVQACSGRCGELPQVLGQHHEDEFEETQIIDVARLQEPWRAHEGIVSSAPLEPTADHAVKGSCAVCTEPVLSWHQRTKSAKTGKYSHRTCADAVARGDAYPIASMGREDEKTSQVESIVRALSDEQTWFGEALQSASNDNPDAEAAKQQQPDGNVPPLSSAELGKFCQNFTANKNKDGDDAGVGRHFTSTGETDATLVEEQGVAKQLEANAEQQQDRSDQFSELTPSELRAFTSATAPTPMQDATVGPCKSLARQIRRGNTAARSVRLKNKETLLFCASQGNSFMNRTSKLTVP